MTLTKRQNQIVEIAIKLIALHGIQNLTIKNLSNEIGISEPALYRHFKSKYDILNAVIDFFIQKTKPALESLKEISNPIDAIEKFINNHLEIFEKNQNLARIIFSESNFQNEEKLLKKLKNLMKNSQEVLEDIISKGQNQGKIRNDISSTSIFRMIIGSLRFLVTQWSISQMNFNLKTEGNSLLNDILKIIKV